MAEAGTSTRVKGPVKYPGFASVVQHWLWHIRGATLAALFCVYGACNQDYGLPAVLRWVRTNDTIQGALRTQPAAAWLQTTFFDGRNDGKTLEDALLFVGITVVLHAVMYFGLNGFFALCDATGFLKQYKLPRTPRMKHPDGLVRGTIIEAIISQAITGPITIFFLYLYVAKFRSMFLNATDSNDMVPQPDLLTTVYHMAMASLCNEVLFYIAHRAFHEIPGCYVRFHKKHHQYVGSIGFAAEHAHPLEQILANQGPTAFYGLFMSATLDQSVWFVWLLWRVWETYEAHSGYCFSGSWLSKIGLTYGERAKFHDWHHSDNRGCYGVYWIDYLFGTMDSYAQLLARGGHPDHPGSTAVKSD